MLGMDSFRIEWHSETVDFVRVVVYHCFGFACSRVTCSCCHLSVASQQPRLRKLVVSLAAALARGVGPRSTGKCFARHSICVLVREELIALPLGSTAKIALTIPEEDLSASFARSL